MHAGLRSALFGSALPLAGFELAMDFRAGWYRSGAVVTRDPAALPGASFTRAGARFEDVGGAPVPVAAHVPAIVPGVGFIARPTYTNLIYNSTATGAAVGVTPTRWLNAGGQTQSVVGVGTENGLPYVDVRIAWDGTQVTTRYAQVIPGSPADYPAAAQGETFAASAYIKLVSGAWPATGTATFQLREFNSSDAFVTSLPQTLKGVGSVAQRIVASRALANANTAKVYSTIEVATGAGEVVDLTLRVYGWSLVKGPIAGPFVPTTAGRVTVPADRMKVALPVPIPTSGDFLIVTAATHAYIGPSVEGTPQAVGHAGIGNSSSSANQIFLFLNAAGTISTGVVSPAGGAVYRGGGKITTPPERAIIALRYKDGAFTTFGRSASGITVQALPAGPVPENLLDVSVGTNSFGNEVMNGAVEFFGYRRGTFSDDQVRGMLAALA